MMGSSQTPCPAARPHAMHAMVGQPDGYPARVIPHEASDLAREGRTA